MSQYVNFLFGFLNFKTHTRTLEGDDSAGADSGRRRGGTGGGTTRSSEPRLKLTMDETEDDPARTGDQQLLYKKYTRTHTTCDQLIILDDKDIGWSG